MGERARCQFDKEGEPRQQLHGEYGLPHVGIQFQNSNLSHSINYQVLSHTEFLEINKFFQKKEKEVNSGNSGGKEKEVSYFHVSMSVTILEFIPARIAVIPL